MNRMLYRCVKALLLATCLVPHTSWAGAETFYVNQESGNDAFSGRHAYPKGAGDGPFATLAAACKAARAVGPETHKSIEVIAGKYFLNESLRLDSPTASHHPAFSRRPVPSTGGGR